MYDIQKPVHIMELYYDLFSHKRVLFIGYELLPFTVIKDASIKQDVVDHNTPIPTKFAHMDWNFDKKKMPKPTWEQTYPGK